MNPMSVPPPWRLVTRPTPMSTVPASKVEDDTGYEIMAETCSEYKTNAYRRAIRDVNCHDDLLAACKEARDAACLAGIHQHPDGGDLPWYSRLNDAIAKAEAQ